MKQCRIFQASKQTNQTAQVLSAAQLQLVSGGRPCEGPTQQSGPVTTDHRGVCIPRQQ